MIPKNICYNNKMIRSRNLRRNKQFGDLTDALKGFLSAGGMQLVLKSNVTPEIIIDVSQLAKPGAEAQTAVQGDPVLMRLIKPELLVRGLGVEKSIAPYGQPQAGMFTMVAVGTAIAGALGAIIAWRICRG